MIAKIVIGAAAFGLGVYVGVKLTKDQVQAGVVGAADDVIRRVGGDPYGDGYGRTAHDLVDAIAGVGLHNE